jgi:hypothetical protein
VTFQHSIMLSSSRVEWTFKPLKTRSLRCLKTPAPITQCDEASHPTRMQTSTAPLRKPKKTSNIYLSCTTLLSHTSIFEQVPTHIRTVTHVKNKIQTKRKPSFVEILLRPCQEVAKTNVQLPLINANSLRRIQERAGTFVSKFRMNYRKPKGRKGVSG